ncbi:tRNA-dihydrouridine synthase family protein [Desulfopila sp. IMCC35008]|uniref:tRNA-dihydrouridine synthase family protein n=1 Tax=Desulfopila sp. IMCC35008 TaxID=2653858 RepID=UPI001F0F5FEF|nr:tRNA-dihydrouridine synthase family protein [Desulfopila sp. IMCC35008]
MLFRTVFSNHFGGFDSAIAPFINPQQSPSKKTHMLADVQPRVNTHLAITPQLLNNNATEFLELAKRLEDLGYTQLNWNLGCPSPMVANKKRGSGLLPYPDTIIKILDTVLPKMNATLSIKMRLGFREKQEGFTLLPLLNEYPLDEIIMHPRLGKQMYKGKTDPDGFAECQTLTHHRLVYNGDITTIDTFSELAARFPAVSRWMIGRGVLQNPFLAEEIKGIDEKNPTKRKKKIREFHDELCEGYRQRLSGPGHLLGKMKQLWLYLYLAFPGKEKVLKNIKKAKTEQQFLDAAEEMFR